jgi:hypothetical protein
MLPATRQMDAQIDFGVPPSTTLSHAQSSLPIPADPALFHFNKENHQRQLISLALQRHLIESSHYSIGVSVV